MSPSHPRNRSFGLYAAMLMIVLISGGLITAIILQINQASERLGTIISDHAQHGQLIEKIHRTAQTRVLGLQNLLSSPDSNLAMTEWQYLILLGSELEATAHAISLASFPKNIKQEINNYFTFINNHTDFDSMDVTQYLVNGNLTEAKKLVRRKILPVEEKRLIYLSELRNLQANNIQFYLTETKSAYRNFIILIGLTTLFAMLSIVWLTKKFKARLVEQDSQFDYQAKRIDITLDSIGDAVITIDTAGNVERLNAAAESILNIKNEAAIGVGITQIAPLIHEYNPDVLLHPVEEVLKTGATIRLDQNTVLIKSNKEKSVVEVTASPVFNASREISGAVIVIRDISENRALATELAYQAKHDSLTGLLNRREFESRLEQAIAEAQRYPQEQVWFCFLDLDQFKLVNDSCGHIAGDELLKQIAYTLTSMTREIDHVARMGGDEFMLILKRCNNEMAVRIMERVLKKIHDMRFCWDQKCLSITASVGIVQITAQHRTIYDLLKNADAACILAKEEGRNRIYTYTESDKKTQQRQGEMEWIHRIYHAIENNRFVLYIQPIKGFNRNDLGLHGEILVRMLDKDGGIIPPYAFIPAAERYNLMPEVDRHIIKLALNTLSRYSNHSQIKFGIISINLSAQSLCDDQFMEFVLTQFANNKISPTNICFEITETAAMSNLTRAVHFITRLKEQGCRFALDDFGSGLSSFGYLKNLPVDFLKIDGSFVKQMTTDALDYTLVSSANQIGHVIGLETIAEFVETPEIEKILIALGVDYGQGYGIARPTPLDGLLDSLIAPKSNNSTG